jgi:hypothetical protein
MAAPNPLQHYLAVQVTEEAKLNAALRDAMADARARITKLAGKEGIGAAVRRSQLRATLASLQAAQTQFWKTQGSALQTGKKRAAVAAANAEAQAMRQLWGKLAGPIPQFEKALAAQAEATVDTLAASLKDRIPLSNQVFKTAALTSGQVNRAISRSIAHGDSWKELADRVTGMINPATPGGVSYAAKRLARTELNNAFHNQQIKEATESPFVTAVQWNLSGSHRVPDKCNDYASHSVKGLERGQWNPAEVPAKPHPQCFCFLTTVHVDDDQFAADFFDGKYNDHIDSTAYRNGQGVC